MSYLQGHWKDAPLWSEAMTEPDKDFAWFSLIIAIVVLIIVVSR